MSAIFTAVSKALFLKSMREIYAKAVSNVYTHTRTNKEHKKRTSTSICLLQEVVEVKTTCNNDVISNFNINCMRRDVHRPAMFVSSCTVTMTCKKLKERAKRTEATTKQQIPTTPFPIINSFWSLPQPVRVPLYRFRKNRFLRFL